MRNQMSSASKPSASEPSASKPNASKPNAWKTSGLVLSVCLGFAGCGGDEESVATFTSQIVQRNTCRITGDQAEACFREDVSLRVRVTVTEDAFDRVWLAGFSLDGEPDARLLGTLDADGGYLFFSETVEVNDETSCRLTETLELSLRVDDEALEEMIGTDPCVALVGRETRTSTTSLACDDINDPPVPVTRIVRRRWEPPARCSAELDDPLSD